MTYNAQKHHRRSIRLKGYNYSQTGAYFVTICTHNHILFFEDDRIRGIAEQCWLEIPRHFRDIELDEWIIMPNHLHGILSIGGEIIRRGTACRAPTPTNERFGKPTSGSLPTIVRSFKATATKRINDLRGTTRSSVWQRNYYERVIRNKDELNRLRRYILDNHVQWNMDENNPNFQGEPLCQLK
ncbi:MAG: transposase [Dehalococcoidia bacterium]|nr:transposase [Dehalococcoidia bacterium]